MPKNKRKNKHRGHHSVVEKPVIKTERAVECSAVLNAVLKTNRTIINDLRTDMSKHHYQQLHGFPKVVSYLDFLEIYDDNDLDNISKSLSTFETHIDQMKKEIQHKVKGSEEKNKLINDLTALKRTLDDVVNDIHHYLDLKKAYRIETNQLTKEEREKEAESKSKKKKSTKKKAKPTQKPKKETKPKKEKSTKAKPKKEKPVKTKKVSKQESKPTQKIQTTNDGFEEEMISDEPDLNRIMDGEE